MFQSLPLRATSVLALACAWSFVRPPSACALTLEEALARAREHAPEVARARARLAEARAVVVGAEVPLRDNPVLEMIGGPRLTVDDSWIPQVGVGIEQQLELSGARSARIDAALAGVERAEALDRDTTRSAIAAVGSAFVDALFARDAHAQSVTVRERADALLQIGEARATAGDVNAIDVRRLRLTAAQARGDEHAARAVLLSAIGRMRALLDVAADESLEIEGSFDEAVSAASLSAPAERAEIAALRAGLREAEAEGRIADARAIPELGVGLGYQHEEGDHMALLRVSLSLPFFEHGQGLRAAADARHDALEAELHRRERVIAVEIEAARDAMRAMGEALAESARAVGDAAELDAMLRRSWEAGETSLTELLLVRAEVQRALRAHLDRQRDAGLARVALEAALGRDR